MNGHERWADSAAAYVLAALPPGELDGFRAHLEECAVCRHEVEQLRVAADALPLGVPPAAPPAGLKGRIMAVVESEAELLAAAGAGADRPPRAAARRRSARRLRPSLALAAVLLLVGAGALAGVLLAGGEGSRTVVAATTAPGADVRLEIADDGATLVARGMPAPPEGRIYQVWLKRPGRDPEPTDVLWSVNAEGAAEVAVPGSLEGVEAVLVTDEPEGGSAAPTREPVITAAPA